MLTYNNLMQNDIALNYCYNKFSFKLQGFIVIHCVLAIYCFLLLGAVCEQYFVPAIDIICEREYLKRTKTEV